MFRFHVPGMTCGGCARSVSNAILSVDPAAEVTTDPPNRAVTVTSSADQQVLVAAIAEAGYRAEPQAEAA